MARLQEAGTRNAEAARESARRQSGVSVPSSRFGPSCTGALVPSAACAEYAYGIFTHSPFVRLLSGEGTEALPRCGGLTLPGCQVPTKAALSLPSSTGQGRENIMKGSWVKIRTGRSLTNYRHGQNRLNLGKLV